MRPKVLVVDDNPDNLEYAFQILDDRYDVALAGTGSMAIDMVESDRRPDLILLDISLPRRDGYQVVSDLRADPSLVGVPIVACTAHAMAGDRERGLAAGFDDYLAKPYRPRELLSILTRFLGETESRLQP